MKKSSISRRRFLIQAGTGVGGLAIFQSAAAKTVVNLLDTNSPLIIPENFEPSVWFTMQSSGKTNVHIYNTEFGQHIGTALAQLVAEELELNWGDIAIDYPSTDLPTKQAVGGVFTGGSMGVLDAFEPLRRCAAIAREFLVEAGADSLGADISDCRAEDGYVIDSAYDQRISYAQILSERQIDHIIQPEDLLEAKLKRPQDYKIIGKSQPALDIPEKVNGSARYGIDAYAPNMVYGKTSLAPTRLGSKIVSVDDSLAEDVPGYITTLRLNANGFPGMGGTDVALVVAKSFPAAMRAEKVINVEWDTPISNVLDEQDLWEEAEQIAKNRNKAFDWLTVGDAKRSMQRADTIVEAEYRTSMIEHAALEPRSALVQPIDGTYHIYSGHQGGAMLIQFIANKLGVSEDKVVYHPHQIGGSFGDKIYADQIVLAAQASKKMALPVKVIMTREDQFNLGHPKSISLHTMRAGISNEASASLSDKILAVEHDVIAAPSSPRVRNGVAFDNVDDQLPEQIAGEVPPPVVTGADHWYDLGATRVSFLPHDMMQRVIPTGAVRSVGNYFTVFAVESFIDELATAMGADPLTLRLSLLQGRGRNAGVDIPDGIVSNLPDSSAYVSAGGNVRLANVLKIASGLANYRSPLIGKEIGQGLSVAAAEGRHNPSFSACVADVSLTRSGFVSIKKLTVCADVGVVVNPEGAKAQIEGSLLWGLSSAMQESATLEGGRLKQSNFDTYKWQRNADLPELDIHLVENGVVPSGIGENTMSLVAPAICNAIAALTGQRLRSLPLKDTLPLKVG
jgi:CO/xanthine dehydrogenase Mo-binding subunit